jgi:oligoendopeptidase F
MFFPTLLNVLQKTFRSVCFLLWKGLAGGDFPRNLFKIAGVDMTSTQPIEDAFEVLSSYIERLEMLTGK